MPKLTKTVFVFTSIALLASVLAAEPPQSVPLPNKLFQNLRDGQTQTVVTYGTSLTHTAEWPKALNAYFDERFPQMVTVINNASSGKQSNWGIANLQKRVLSKKPDLVFIEFSMNDSATKHGISVEKATSNLDQMIKALRKENPEVEIILMTMNTVWNSPAEPRGGGSATARPHLLDYYEAYLTYARKQQLPIINHTIAWQSLQQTDAPKFKEWLPDGTHPIAEASLAITWEAIQTMLEQAEHKKNG